MSQPFIYCLFIRVHVLLRSRGVRLLSHQVVKVRSERFQELARAWLSNFPGDLMSNVIWFRKAVNIACRRAWHVPQWHPKLSSLGNFFESVEVIIDVPYSTLLVNCVFNPLRSYSNLHRTHQQFFKSFLPSTVNVRVPVFGCIWSSSPSLPSILLCTPRKKCLCLKPPESELFLAVSPKKENKKRKYEQESIFYQFIPSSSAFCSALEPWCTIKINVLLFFCT